MCMLWFFWCNTDLCVHYWEFFFLSVIPVRVLISAYPICVCMFMRVSEIHSHYFKFILFSFLVSFALSCYHWIGENKIYILSKFGWQICIITEVTAFLRKNSSPKKLQSLFKWQWLNFSSTLGKNLNNNLNIRTNISNIGIFTVFQIFNIF